MAESSLPNHANIHSDSDVQDFLASMKQKSKEELVNLLAHYYLQNAQQAKEIDMYKRKEQILEQQQINNTVRVAPEILNNLDHFLDQFDNISPPKPRLTLETKSLAIRVEVEEEEEEEQSIEEVLLDPELEYEEDLEDNNEEDDLYATTSINEMKQYPRYHVRHSTHSALVKQRTKNLISKARSVGYVEFDTTEMGADDFKSVCYECKGEYVKKPDPRSAYGNVGVICDGCKRTANEFPNDPYYYHCSVCETVDLCITCYCASSF